MRREPACLGFSPLRSYKDNTFSCKNQIALTFRNTPQMLKMWRFAADGVWQVLYYEAHLEGASLGTKRGGRRGLHTHTIRAKAKSQEPTSRQ